MREKDISNKFQKKFSVSQLSVDHLNQSHPKCLLKMLISSAVSKPTGPESVQVGLGICVGLLCVCVSLNNVLLFLIILWVN